MPAVSSVLIVGAGVAGTAAAILLAEGGVDVDLIEQKSEVTALGSGITLQGNALRVFRQLGVWPEIERHGYSFTTLGLRAPDAAGSLIVEMPDARTGGPDLPATVGMPRPELARILVERAAEVGARVRFGVRLDGLEQQGETVQATFDDGSTARYDLVIGADGLHSRVREAIGIDVKPQPTGMAIWRVFTPRPASVTRTDLTYGGPCYIAGYCPTGEDSLYAYLVEPADPANFELSGPERVARMRALSEAYHGPWDDIRPYITDDRGVNYTFFEAHVVDGPWNRGRVVIIGDAAHSCPPTLAQGAAQSLEDAAVLAELMLNADELDDGLWQQFTGRRLGRAREVVQASVQLGQWMIDHDQSADVPGLMGRIGALVTEPA
ncbi:FAD-dependent monooxygenase [Microbacterium sp. STN6]|uniref:FAD-dependent monooxygenase n=1 Tax=Microbacterium sp. STN6 TaxID=2995588 RepID=UPI002260E8E4|nr:FAD-dependent monooxygenase [Microbacterium sp. STN6]MCX7522271.1 FAD-dependent monooxygenase [Microbacterium sp. STN6]